jgi:hypothetical protein
MSSAGGGRWGPARTAGAKSPCSGCGSRTCAGSAGSSTRQRNTSSGAGTARRSSPSRSLTGGAAWCRCSGRRREGRMTERDESPEALAHALVGRIFDLLHECRAVVPKLEMPPARPESASAQAERVLYVALLGAIEVGLVARWRTRSPCCGRPASPSGRWATTGSGSRSSKCPVNPIPDKPSFTHRGS